MRYPIWKPILLVAVVLLSALLLRTQGLNPGIDLAGGTTLTYSVQVPESADTRTAIEDTIEILKDRVDPRGIRNLVWRSEAGNRLTVQMAAGPAGGRRASPRAGAGPAGPARRQPRRAGRGGGDVSLRPGAGGRREPAGRDAPRPGRGAARPRSARRRAGREASGVRRGRGDRGEPGGRGRGGHRAARRPRRLPTRRSTRCSPRRSRRRNSTASSRSTPTPPRARPTRPRAQAVAALKEAAPDRVAEIDAVVAAANGYDAVKGPLDDPNDLIRLLRGAGVLEFRIAATPGERPADVDRYRDLLAENGPRAGRGEPWRWFPLRDVMGFIDNREDKPYRDAIEQNPEAAAQILQQRRAAVRLRPGRRRRRTCCWPTAAASPSPARTTGRSAAPASASTRTARPSVNFGIDRRRRPAHGLDDPQQPAAADGDRARRRGLLGPDAAGRDLQPGLDHRQLQQRRGAGRW